MNVETKGGLLTDWEVIEEADRKLNECAEAATKKIRETERRLQQILKFQFWSSKPEHRLSGEAGNWTLGWDKFADSWRFAVLDPDEASRLLESAPRLVRILAAKQLDSLVAEAANKADAQVLVALRAKV